MSPRDARGVNAAFGSAEWLYSDPYPSAIARPDPSGPVRPPLEHVPVQQAPRVRAGRQDDDRAHLDHLAGAERPAGEHAPPHPAGPPDDEGRIVARGRRSRVRHGPARWWVEPHIGPAGGAT